MGCFKYSLSSVARCVLCAASASARCCHHFAVSTRKSTPGRGREIALVPRHDRRRPQQPRDTVRRAELRQPSRVGGGADCVGREAADRQVIDVVRQAVGVERHDDGGTFASNDGHQRAADFLRRRSGQLFVGIREDFHRIELKGRAPLPEAPVRESAVALQLNRGRLSSHDRQAWQSPARFEYPRRGIAARSPSSSDSHRRDGRRQTASIATCPVIVT